MNEEEIKQMKETIISEVENDKTEEDIKKTLVFYLNKLIGVKNP